MEHRPPIVFKTAGAVMMATLALFLDSCAAKHVAPPVDEAAAKTRALRANIDTIVTIYAENRAFDVLYGNFPGAHGLNEVVDRNGRPLPAYHPQVDRNGSELLPTLPPAWGGVTAPGYLPVVTQQQSTGLPNAPFSIEHAYSQSANVTLSSAAITRDLWHRFFEHQMQIDGGKNDGFAAWSDAGGLSMGHFDYSHSALYQLAREFVLADNFFQGAFGGSYLNHQYLICACAPQYPDANLSPASPSISILEQDAAGRFLPRLKVRTPAMGALDEPPRFVKSGNIAPLNYFGDGKFYAVNTMQPPYQPSGNAPAARDISLQYADPANATTLPPQSELTIGDELNAKHVAWTWYSGAWNAAYSDGTRPAGAARRVIYAPDGPGGNPNFQPHHQPFNYYSNFDPATHAPERAAHLKDYDDLIADIDAGRLPPVVFYKPQGNLNQHPGYASLDAGDAHIAALVDKLRSGRQWQHMLIVITYDEYGGAWDHVAPPVGDLLGPGTRIPALIISPFAKHGTVDHTQYDTGSVLRLIMHRFDLPILPGIKLRDAGLAARGQAAMGDLTSGLALNN